MRDDFSSDLLKDLGNRPPAELEVQRDVVDPD